MRRQRRPSFRKQLSLRSIPSQLSISRPYTLNRSLTNIRQTPVTNASKAGTKKPKADVLEVATKDSSVASVEPKAVGGKTPTAFALWRKVTLKKAADDDEKANAAELKEMWASLAADEKAVQCIPEMK